MFWDKFDYVPSTGNKSCIGPAKEWIKEKLITMWNSLSRMFGNKLFWVTGYLWKQCLVE